MKKYLLLGWMCAWGILLFAQEDPVLMRINGQEVPRSEFAYFYRRYCTEVGMKLSSKDYVELFINRKLKIDAARVAGMDTLSSFRKAQRNYRDELLKSYVTDKQVTDSCVRISYDKMKAAPRNGQVQVMQIVRYLPQAIMPSRLRVEQARMDSLYEAIKNQPNQDFYQLVERFSDNKQPSWIEYLQNVPELENIAFSLAQGEISRPFFTPSGIHILKVVERREAPSYEVFREQNAERNKHNMVLNKGVETMVERLKKEYQYVSNSPGIEELLSGENTNQTLFTIDGRTYTGEMFKLFASSHPQAIKRQLDGFISKSVLDYEANNIEKKHPDVRSALREYEESTLIAQITDQQVELPAIHDRAGLATYFKFHQSDYRWQTPRYRGIVLHCADKKVAKLAKKIIKKVPEKEWADTLRKAFNVGGVDRVKVEQGLFARGDNKYIDKLVFKEGYFEPVMSYPFTVVAGEKRKGPSEYREVIEQLRKDYRNYLAVCWVQDLKTSSKVEINQEVLKTVNND